jgi:putative tricarboxylic transport membrane protein
MWDNIFHGLAVALDPSHLLVVLVGTVAGLIIGALPGLSAVSGVALLLPFTFTMDPAQGLIMLAAVYMAAEYGGSVSAILINTPGTSGAACTTLDGTPLTQRGEAMEALYTSLLAGTVGGVFGTLVLIFFTPLLARASLMLGPAEIFWIAIAGLGLVASLSGGQPLKGLIGVTLGVALTLVGQDVMSGDMRFTFDNYHLVGGIPTVPALLGLFAVASILNLLDNAEESVAPMIVRQGALRSVVRRLSRMKALLTWSSVLGTGIGIVPGAGASISAFVAYGEAKRMSKHPEEFGRGSYEGVAAPECANNAVVGGAMVPLLGLGIPGSGSAAILYGALTIHGIIPGPRLFTERPEVVYTFMAGLFLAVFAMLLVGLLTIRWSSLIVKVPRKALVPAVLVLSAVGTYGLSNSLFDVYVMLIIGVSAYVLTRIGIPAATVALGLVLGRLTEESYQQSVMVGQVDHGSILLYFASRPVALILMLFAFAILAGGMLQMLKGRSDASEETAITAHETQGMTMRAANLVLALVLTGFAVLGLIEITSLSETGALFPRLVSILLAVFAVLLVAYNSRGNVAQRAARIHPFTGVPWRHVLGVIVSLALLALGAPWIGFYEAAFLFLFVVYLMLSERHRPIAFRLFASATYSCGFVVFTYLIFKMVLGIQTPHGLLV